MLELAILGLLRDDNLHGYELNKRLSELPGNRTTSYGSLYPALARLERSGLVEPVGGNGAGGELTPMAGSLAGEAAAFRSRRSGDRRDKRNKKVYGITEQGEQRLRELLLDDNGADDRTFPLRVAFCRFLPPERRLELFERRHSALADRLADHPGSDDNTDLDHYRRSLRERDHTTITNDLAWLDQLIEAERRGPDNPQGAPS